MKKNIELELDRCCNKLINLRNNVYQIEDKISKLEESLKAIRSGIEKTENQIVELGITSQRHLSDIEESKREKVYKKNQKTQESKIRYIEENYPTSESSYILDNIKPKLETSYCDAFSSAR